MKERHGIPAIADLTATARHEAGHLLGSAPGSLMAAPAERADGCGVTKALDAPGEKETPHQRILYAMAGMVLAGEFDLYSGPQELDRARRVAGLDRCPPRV